jgi:uncharacterized protein (DUF1501 family)
MPLTRRQFLQSASAAAALAGAHVLFAGRAARAAAPDDPILVLVNLRGGNDALNTVIPLDDVGAPQRSLYEALRPDLAIPTALLGATEIDPDPERGTGLALHPALPGLTARFQRGQLAVVNGAGLEESSLSHFVAEDVWYSGDPSGREATGWVGRHLDAMWNDPVPRALSFGATVNQTLAARVSGAIGIASAARLRLPAVLDPNARRHARTAVNAVPSGSDTLRDRIARASDILMDEAEIFRWIETSGWGSRNEAGASALASQLRDVASILRHDLAYPGDATGLCFFHTTLGGFDTHASQGATQPEATHPRLLAWTSTALDAFQEDLEQLGIAHRVVTLVYSEFGRRASQNGSGSLAGTDHGRGGTVLVMGDPVAGGVYGALPDLADLDRHGNLRATVDFRRVYAELIDGWLGGDHTAVLPGAPFAPLPLLV